MMSVPPQKVYKDSSGLRKWLIGCFVVAPFVCCGGVVLFARRWVDTFDYSADLDHQVAEAKKHGLPMESKDLTAGVSVFASDNSYAEVVKLMNDYPKLEKITKALSTFVPSRSSTVPDDIQKFVQRAKTIAKFKSFDAHRDYDLGPTLLYPEFAYMKQLSRALAVQAQQDAANRRVNSAIEDLRLIRSIAHQLIREKVLIGGLVNLTINATFYRTTSKTIGWLESDPDALVKVRALIAEDSPTTDPYSCFLGEFYMGVSYMRNFKLFGGLNGLKSDNMPQVDPQKVERTGLPTDLMPRAMLGSFIKHEMKQQEIFLSNKNAMIRGKKFDEYLVSVPMTVSNSYILIIAPVWAQAGVAWEKQKLNKVMLLKCIDLIQHKKNGAFPGEIEDIPDTVGGGTLTYKRTADGFTIYSLGPNQKDDGGIRNKTDRRNSDDFGFEYPFIQKN